MNYRSVFLSLLVFTIALNATAQMNQLDKAKELLFFDKYAQALKIVNNAIAEQPTNYKAYLLKAKIYGELDDESEWEPSLKKALEVAPLQAEVYVRYGGYLEGSNRTDEALKLYKQGITLIPKSAELHYKVGVIYDDSLKNQQEALRYYEKAVDLNPTKPHYYYMIGAVLRDLGNLKKAYVAFSQALAQHARKKNDNIN